MLSKRLKKFRLALGLTQEDVANALGIERTTYTYYEIDKHEPNIARLQALAKLYNTDIPTLLGEDAIDGSFGVADDVVEYGEKFDKFNELKKDEALLLLYYRRLDAGKKAKLIKSVKDKFNK